VLVVFHQFPVYVASSTPPICLPNLGHVQLMLLVVSQLLFCRLVFVVDFEAVYFVKMAARHPVLLTKTGFIIYLARNNMKNSLLSV
jgi:hypothetical protein